MRIASSGLLFASLLLLPAAQPATARPVKPGDPKEGTCEIVTAGFYECTEGGKVYWCTGDKYSKDTCQEAPRYKRPTVRNMKLLLAPLRKAK